MLGLFEDQIETLTTLLQTYPDIILDVPEKCTLGYYDVGTTKPVNLSPYRVNPEKQRLL